MKGNSISHYTSYLILCCGLSLFCSLTSLHAQNTEPLQETRYTIWGGYSVSSVKLLGKTGDSQSQILRIGFQKHLKNLKQKYSFWYTADLIPVIYFDYPKRDENDRRATRRGFGLSPVGFMFKNPQSDWFTPYLHTTGGIIYMNDYFPTDKSRRLNFTFDIIIGNTIKFNSFSEVSLGYNFHHISNAETGEQNPGLDSNFFFLTLSIH